MTLGSCDSEKTEIFLYSSGIDQPIIRDDQIQKNEKKPAGKKLL